jgi:hypothetical protein
MTQRQLSEPIVVSWGKRVGWSKSRLDSFASHVGKGTVKTGPTGALPLRIPRATVFTPHRPREWQSAIVPRYARRAAEVNATVIATYLAGTNTRRIRGALDPLLKAAPLSKSAVSRVVATLREGLEAWMTRSLAEVDGIVLYLDAIALRVPPPRSAPEGHPGAASIAACPIVPWAGSIPGPALP